MFFLFVAMFASVVLFGNVFAQDNWSLHVGISLPNGDFGDNDGGYALAVNFRLSF